MTAGGVRWSVSEPGARFHWSSPAIADVDGDGSADVVVGGLNGRLYAFDAAGRALSGWAGGSPAPAAIASSPAVADLDGDGSSEVVVGVGSLEVAGQGGGVVIYGRGGGARCSFPLTRAVFNAPAIGDVDGDGRPEVVFGSFDHGIYVIDAGCRLEGFFESKDTIFSSPALFDVDGNGSAEIFIGVDASRNPATGESLDGGYFRSLRFQAGARHPDGHMNLVQRWERRSTETFQSPAAIADIDGDGRPEAVTGSGAYWCRFFSQCADSAKVWAFHLDDGSDVAGWPRTASFETTFLSAPALGDIDGDGRTDVVVGTNQYDQGAANRAPNGGAVDVFYGDPAKPRRTFVSPDLEVVAPVAIADVTGGGTPEVLVSTASQVFALGPDLSVVEAGIATSPAVNRKSSVAVGRLGDRWGLVSAGFDGALNGVVQVHDIAEPTSTPWPMHRKNARRLGTAEPAPPRSGFVDVPDSSVYSDAVRWAADAGVTSGCTAIRFCPSANVTRAQAATFLWRLVGRPSAPPAPFTDIDQSAFYAPAVGWVSAEQITSGCGGDRFCPNGSASRAQLVTFLWRTAGAPDAGVDHGFADVAPGAFYEEAVTWAVRTGITSGTTLRTFEPNVAVNRGQTVLFLARYDAGR